MDGVRNIRLYGLEYEDQWGVTFEYGDIFGESYCHNSSSVQPPNGWGGYCWCRVTKYRTSSSAAWCSLIEPEWLFLVNDRNDTNCGMVCASQCAAAVKTNGSDNPEFYPDRYRESLYELYRE